VAGQIVPWSLASKYTNRSLWKTRLAYKIKNMEKELIEVVVLDRLKKEISGIRVQRG
jgi:hypothetical protein